MKKCEFCNKTFDDDIEFCPECGRRLTSVSNEEKPVNTSNIQEETTIKPKVDESTYKKDDRYYQRDIPISGNLFVIQDIPVSLNEKDKPPYEQRRVKMNMKKISIIEKIKFSSMIIFSLLLIVIPFIKFERGKEIKTYSFITGAIDSFKHIGNYSANFSNGYMYTFVIAYSLAILIASIVAIVLLFKNSLNGDYGQKKFYESVCNKEDNQDKKYIRLLESRTKLSVNRTLEYCFEILIALFIYFIIDSFTMKLFISGFSGLVTLPIIFLIIFIVFLIIETIMKSKLKKIINSK